MSNRSAASTGLSVLWFLACVTAAGGQVTWHVDDDAPGDPGAGDPTVSDPAEDGSADHPFDAIQEGVNASTHGDVVIVADGLYTGEGNREIDLGGKDILLRSANGPAGCVIDCEALGRGFYFHSDEAAATVVDGFTVRNSFSNDGGGVHIDSASPTIRNCAIVENEAAAGGGLFITGTGSPTITNCTIAENEAWNEGGGVIIRGSSSPVIADCAIIDNTTGQFGAGVILSTDGTAVIVNCTISGNTAISHGGGFTCFGGNSIISHCTIADNTAMLHGGGLFVISNNLTITNCTISGNRVDRYGGAIDYYYGGSPTLSNCLITGNTATETGGGVACGEGAAPVIIGCTFIGNRGTSDAGGVVCDAVSSPMIINSILWGNTESGVGSQIIGKSAAVTYSCIEGGWGGVGNTAENPLLTALGSWDDNGTPSNPDDDVWVAGNERLQPGSPCINTGDPLYQPLTGDTDFDGHARVLCGFIDMGVYEFGIGDYDCNQSVDLGDFSYWGACMTGPEAGPYSPGCEAFDFNFDNDVDQQDFLGFNLLFDGG